MTKLGRDLSDAEGVVQGLALTYESQRFTKRQGPNEAQEFWQVDGRPGIINKLNQVFTHSTESIDYATTPLGLVRAYKAHREILESKESSSIYPVSVVNL